MTRAHPGLLISLDGLGGAGKTTTVHLLAQRLTEHGHTVHATTEPSRAPLGELARHHTDTYRGLALACLVAADRYHHLDTEIHPHLAAGHIVLCDRYVASSYVLQRMDGVPLEFVQALNTHAQTPDLAVLLTADPAVTTARIHARGAHGRFETGIETSTAEAMLYREANQHLATLGFPLVTVDTTNAPQHHVVEDIAARIAHLTGGR